MQKLAGVQIIFPEVGKLFFVLWLTVTVGILGFAFLLSLPLNLISKFVIWASIAGAVICTFWLVSIILTYLITAVYDLTDPTKSPSYHFNIRTFLEIAIFITLLIYLANVFLVINNIILDEKDIEIQSILEN